MKKFLSLSAGLILIGNFLFAQTFTAVASGNWDSNVTWGTALGVFPGAAGGRAEDAHRRRRKRPLRRHGPLGCTRRRGGRRDH